MPNLALYYSPGACSLAAHAALKEWGAPFELRRVTIAKGEHRQPDFMSLNPRSRVPVLLIDEKPVRELSGILTWIGLQSGLYPEAGSYEAAKCGEWLAWLTSAVHISFALIWRGERFVNDPRLYPLVRARGYEWLDEQFGEIETALEDGGPYLLGERYSVVDCNILPFYRWGNRVGLDMAASYPAWTAHTRRMIERPAIKAALAAEEIDIWQSTDPGMSPKPNFTKEQLAQFAAAWGAGDVEALMSLMAPTGVYSASVGAEPGETFKGTEALRKGFSKMLAYDSTRVSKPGELWYLGDFAFGTWGFEEPGGKLVRGMDYFEFSAEGVTLKDAYRKTTG